MNTYGCIYGLSYAISSFLSQTVKMKCANSIVVCLLLVAVSVFSECQPIGTTCNIFYFVEYIIDWNMSLYMDNHIMCYHMDYYTSK